MKHHHRARHGREPGRLRLVGARLRRLLRHPPTWLLPVVGLLSLVWYVLRVGPKPGRAAYPCQQAAAPIAASFLVWVGAVVTWVAARRTGVRLWARSRFLQAAICLAVAAGALVLVLRPFFAAEAVADAAEPHGPLGAGKGVYPGRVVWVHAPEATNWEGPDSDQRWYSAACTDQATVDRMMASAIRTLAGEPTDEAAWDRLFRHFNEAKGKGERGYAAGEKIAIKLNLVTCWAAYQNSSPWVDPVTLEKTRYPNHVDVAPQMVRALLSHLVQHAGMAQADIAVGDPTAVWPEEYLAVLKPSFPEVLYVDNWGATGRTRAEFSTRPIHWSTPAAEGTRQDYLPTVFAEADYVINFAVLKGHSSGITVCAKNHYGSLIRLPNGHLWYDGKQDYYDLHLSLPNREWTPGRGHYRAMVDLMGHADLGGKTLLYLIDGLYGGYYAESRPTRWLSPPFGDGTTGDWPSSLFVSQDPVAIDSVAHDFLLNEWPRVVTGGTREAGSLEGGQEDYLHEAALAHDPPSGTLYDPDRTGIGLASLGVHEHWNNPIDKQYSRNLGLDEGIELVAIQQSAPPTHATLELFRGYLSQRGEVTLHWRTLLEVDTLGFHLDRAGVAAPWTRVTRQLIPANGGPAGSHVYQYQDRVEGGLAGVRYRLVSVNLAGQQKVLAEIGVVGMPAMSVVRDGTALVIRLTGPATTGVDLWRAPVLDGATWSAVEVAPAISGADALEYRLPIDPARTAEFYRLGVPAGDR